MVPATVHKQLYTYIEQNNIPFEHKYGFSKHKSIAQVLPSHLQFVCYSIDFGQKLCYICILPDFNKAFDPVDLN